MRIVTATTGGADFERMAQALQRSILANCPPGTGITIATANLPPGASLFDHNTAKLRLWHTELCRAQDHTILMDADTCCLRDLSPAFHQNGGAPEWDIAYTTRPHPTKWLNAGVVFCQPTAGALAFVTKWLAGNEALMADADRLALNTASRGGVNQAALIELLNSPGGRERTTSLPCDIWNSTEETWDTYDDHRTHIIHIKGTLRRVVLDGLRRRPQLTQIADRYKEFLR